MVKKIMEIENILLLIGIISFIICIFMGFLLSPLSLYAKFFLGATISFAWIMASLHVITDTKLKTE